MKVFILLSMIFVSEASLAIQVRDQGLASSRAASSANVSKSLSSFRSGNEGGGGGDESGLDFQSSFQIAMKNAKVKYPEIYNQIRKANIEDLIHKVKIITVNDPLDVKMKDLIQNSVAMNFPEKNLILVNRDRWAGINNQLLKQGVALHELLSLARIENTGDYSLSAQYVSVSGESTAELVSLYSAPLVCLRKATQMLSSDPVEFAVELCKGASSDAPINCFHEISDPLRFKLGYIRENFIALCSGAKTAMGPIKCARQISLESVGYEPESLAKLCSGQ